MSGDDSLRLDNQLCFLLYGASRAVTQLYGPLLEPLGLTYPQYLVLLVLWERDGTSVRTLCDKLYLDSGTLTPLLSRMVAADLLRRERSTSDARVVDIYLTAAGKKLKRAARAIPEALLCRLGLQQAELGRLHGKLKRLFTLTKEKAA